MSKTSYKLQEMIRFESNVLSHPFPLAYMHSWQDYLQLHRNGLLDGLHVRETSSFDDTLEFGEKEKTYTEQETAGCSGRYESVRCHGETANCCSTSTLAYSRALNEANAAESLYRHRLSL